MATGSIYKFMAGIVDDKAGSQGNDDFDPHDHRVIHKPTSYLDTMTHLLKGCIGAGILAMPHACQRLGIIASIVVLIIVGLFATFCMQMLIRAQYRLCKRWRRGYMAYPKSMLFAVREGPPCLRWSATSLYYFVDAILLFWQLGICTIFLVFVSENIKQVLDFYGHILSLRILLCFLLPPTILLNLVRDLKMLSPLSFTSNVVTVFGFMIVFFYLIEDDLIIGADKWQVKNWMDLPNFVGTALFAMEAVGVVLALEYNMAKPKEFVGICGLFNIGMVIIVSLYIVVGIFGYMKYGDDIKASITLNLPQNQKKAQAAKIIFAIAIFLSFPLQNFVAYNILWRRLRKRVVSTCFPDYCLRVFLVVLPWAIAVSVPQLGPFISLCGALGLSHLCMIFPAFMNICINYDTSSKFGPFNYLLYRDVGVMIIGFLILISGMYSSINEIIENFG